jgi:alpha-tubulin suppressor-like RCC1 family protein
LEKLPIRPTRRSPRVGAHCAARKEIMKKLTLLLLCLFAFGCSGSNLGASGGEAGDSGTESVGSTQQRLDTVTVDYTYNSSNNYVVTATTSPGATSVELFWGASSMGVDSSPPFTWTLTAGTGNGTLNAFANFSGGGTAAYQLARIPQQAYVSPGRSTSCFTWTGKLYCTGRGSYGALGNGGTTDTSTPVQVGTGKNFSKVKMHKYGGCWVDQFSNQMVSCWGRNLYGITGLDPAVSPYSTTPQTINSNQGVDDLAVGDFHACFLRNGDVYCWGSNTNGQLGNGTTTSTHAFVGPVLTGVTKIAAGGDTTCAIKTNGDLYCWGRDDYGQVGNGGSAVSAVTSPVLLLPNITDIAVGLEHTCSYNSSTGAINCWGRNNNGQLMQGTPDASTHVSPALATLASGSVTAMAAGYGYNTCIIQSGTLKCVGENTVGEMGNNTTSAFETTLKTATGFTSGIASYGIGGGVAIGFRAGHIYAWGSNSFGQLGDPSLGATQLTPNQIPGF